MIFEVFLSFANVDKAGQKAAKSKSAFHIDDAANGLPLAQSVHGTGHSAYNAKVKSVLDELINTQPNMTNDQAFNHLQGLNNHLKDLFDSNPNLNVGQIADLISYP